MEPKEQPNPFEELINNELAKAMDTLGKNVPSPRNESQAPSDLAIFIEFFHDAKFVIRSIIYETMHKQEVSRFKPEGRYVGGIGIPAVIPLDVFVASYYKELDHRGVQYDKEKIMLGETLADGILHRQHYHDTSLQMLEEVDGILNFLKQTYNP